MAKILLNVELNDKGVASNLKTLESGIKNIANNLGNVKVNKNLTAQLNALTKNYNALAKAAAAAQKVNNKQAIDEQKLAKATAQAATAEIAKQKATVQLETATIRLTKVQEQGTTVVKKSTQANEKHKQSILSMAAGFFQWQMAATMVMQPLQKIRNAWASINETLVKTEDAVISLKRVLNDSSLSDSGLSGKLYELAQRYGQTFENVNDIAQNFARTGMSWNETIQATESALLALNVAELDATQASDGMIAIMQQFGKEASDLTGIIDSLNKVADNYAVTTDKLLTALQRTGSSAANANLSLEETVGLITALSESTGRSGENLGTAINSLIQYSSKSEALDTFAKLDENMASVVEKYRKGGATILEVWNAVSEVINNMDSRQEGILSGLANSEDITNLNQELQDELGDIFESINDVYGTANTFRKNYFIALLGNMKTVQEATETAQNAAGYSQKENEQYLDSYTAKVNTLKAKWEELANDEQGLLGMKKTLVELGTNILSIINKLGGLKGIFNIALAAISPFVAKWTIVFGAKGIASIKTFFATLKSGAISANAALGAIGLILGVIAAAVSATKNAIVEAEEKKEEWIAKTNQLSETALSSLDDVKSKIEEVGQQYLELAKDSDKYTKTLTEQEKLQKETYEQSLKGNKEKAEKNALSDAKEYLEENYSNIYNAQKLLSEKSNSSATLKYGWWSKNPALDAEEIREIIERYNIEGLNSVYYGPNDFELLLSPFGYKGYNSGLTTQDTTLEQRAELYQKLFDALTKEENSGKGSDQLSYTKSWLQDEINNLKGQYESSRELLTTAKPYQDFVDGKISYDEFLKKIGVAIEETIKTEKSWEDQAKNLAKTYSEVLDKINKMRDAEQQIVDLEEKKKALEDARNNRNVRVFNASTGEWELQADQNAIEKAEKDYEDAVWKNLQTEIKENNLTVGGIYEKIKEISTELPDLAKTIRDAFVAQGIKMPEYDSGGVLRGLGGIKATNENEIVLPPDITKKILTPSSNEQFSQFVKDLGLLFGSSRQVMDMKKGMVLNNGGNTSTDNRSYVANGVPFSREMAETHTLAELFEMAETYEN